MSVIKTTINIHQEQKNRMREVLNNVVPLCVTMEHYKLIEILLRIAENTPTEQILEIVNNLEK